VVLVLIWWWWSNRGGSDLLVLVVAATMKIMKVVVGVSVMWWSGSKIMMIIDEIIGWYCKWIIICKYFMKFYKLTVKYFILIIFFINYFTWNKLGKSRKYLPLKYFVQKNASKIAFCMHKLLENADLVMWLHCFWKFISRWVWT
jgi:hypothetical protein